jgi:5-methylcytosine-specific restriction enzyme A
MSTKRRERARAIRDPDGGYFCSCGCGKKPIRPRINWHSQECVDQWKIMNDPGEIRRIIVKRDRGICAVCGVDADKAYRAWCLAEKESSRLVEKLYWSGRGDREWDETTGSWKWRGDYQMTTKEVRARRESIRVRFGTPNPGWTSGRVTGWDADHIVPVVDGGGQCGLENYRTLCHPCHKAATRELAARRALARRKKLDHA